MTPCITSTTIWRASSMTCKVVGRPSRAFDLIRLRDLPRREWNADTLFIRCSGVDNEHLQRMARDRWYGEVEVVPPD
ncbi:MAG TPA: hypothetical protein VFE42_12905, partial [Chloroflexota bacterium]|nr:hypothetical protein [Chloroflexota bacterium]